ncbi:MAG: kelch repeat-containing protein [Limisphaerales bacterium]
MLCALALGFNLAVTPAVWAASFVNTAPLPTARGYHTTTLLPNGKVLVTGGYGSGPTNLSSADLYDPAIGTWTTTGALGTSRAGHTATLLPNGKVLVAGGYNSTSGYLTSAELYDPATGMWTATGALNVDRGGHTTTLLPNGKVLMAGGGDDTRRTELYDPATGTWTVTGALNANRSAHTATLLPNGKVLVAGGAYYDGVSLTRLTSTEVYDPATGTWTITGTMSIGRDTHTGTLLANGKVLVVGGFGAFEDGSVLASAELYDPATGTWTASGALNTNRWNHMATLLPNGKVLVTGGDGDLGRLASAELYDPATGIWTASGVMNIGRWFHTMTLLPNGKVLIVGGEDNSGTLNGVELYDSAVGMWTAAGTMSTARSAHTMTLLPNGKVLVAGGYSGSVFPTSAELHDPVTGTWTATGDLSFGRNSHTATLLPNGKVLVAGGWNGVAGLSSTELYDPSTGAWTTTGALGNTRHAHTATLLPNGKVFVVGGYSVGTVLTSAELYDPGTGTWTTSAAMSGSRNGHTATLLPNGKVLITGGANNSGYQSAAELFDPTTGTWTTTGTLSTVRASHTATLLPNGKVLVSGGGGDGGVMRSAELYEPATGVWTATGTLNISRASHSATSLPSGKVLVAGGSDGAGNNYYLASAELYDPATGAWTETAGLSIARGSEAHRATLLPSGKVLISGGKEGATGSISSPELYDVGLGFGSSWQPQITAFTSPIISGNTLTLTGTRFRGISGGSGGKTQDSPGDCPVVQLRSLENGQTVFLRSTNWSTNAYTSTGVSGLPSGWVMATMFVNGIPSSNSPIIRFGKVVQSAPVYYWPGVPVPVVVEYGPATGTLNHSLTVQLPTTAVTGLLPDSLGTGGLAVGYRASGSSVKLYATNISHSGVWNAANGTVKWGPFFDSTPRRLTYTVVPVLGWTNAITLTVALSEDSVTTGNDSSMIQLNPAHPADNGPATDQLLSIFEVAAYSAAWRKSLGWHVPPTPIDQNWVTAAGAIWKTGEYYTNGPASPPQRWQSAPLPPGYAATNSSPVAAFSVSAASAYGSALRQLTATPGGPAGAQDITLSVTPAASVQVFLLEEQLPPGWTVGTVSAGGVWDTNFNKVKWGPVFSSAPATYTYTAVPPAGARGIHAFNGLAAFDGDIIAVAGQAELSLDAAPIAPYVLVQPTGRTVKSGDTVSFGVVVGGTAPLTFQWRKNGFNVAGATSASLTLNSVTTSTKGNYDVVISSAGGSVTSFPATLTVLAVSFNGMMVFGDSISDTGNSPASPANLYFNGRFSNGSLWEEILAPKIGVTYDPALNYAVSGAETGDLAFQVASVSAVNGQLCTLSAGGNDFINNFGVGVDDFVWGGIINTAVGNITSAISSLHAKGGRSFLVLNLADMGQLPGTRQNVPSLMTYAGQKTVQFNTALANALTTLQGQLTGSSIKVADVYGRVNQILAAPGTFGFTVTTVDALSDGALADKSFTGPGANYLFWDAIHPSTKGHAQISTAAEVALGIFGSTVTAPAITQQPQGATVVAGARVLLGVGATGTAPMTYQWRRNGTVLTNATSPMLILANIQSGSAGNYDAVVSNAAGSVTSSPPAVVTVTGGVTLPVISAQPLDQTVIAGSNVTFSVAATGTPPLVYQWFRNGAPLGGATAATLNLTAVTRAVSGIYLVGITNAGVGLLSSNAVLRVLVPQRLQSPQRGGGGQFQLRFDDPDGALGSDLSRFEVHHTTNFLGANTAWVTNSGNFTISNGKILFDDAGSLGTARRYYRVIEK